MKNIHVILSPEAEEIYKYLNEHASTSKIEQRAYEIIGRKNITSNKLLAQEVFDEE